MPSMTKSQIAATIAERAGIQKHQAAQVIEELAKLACKEAKNTFVVPGFGKLVVVRRPARRMIFRWGSRAGESFIVPAARVVKFRLAKVAAEAILAGKTSVNRGVGTRSSPGGTSPTSSASHGRGGGFGTPEENKKVERKAIAFVTKRFRAEGWKVESRERNYCGYDLHCTRTTNELHVEVKGTKGGEPKFIITQNELTTAKTDSHFRLWVVLNALSAKRSCRQLTGKQLLAQYRFSPIQYMATSKQ